ncbi:MAG TPA: deoxyguanosinetriphosphate triphosphohydrolase [Candidatus Goldiibacteriota bacterium]|nr:deoxyguanosinetriphosphate triphosphohydrolase [Candidatus Goldiibacteriota bacterium]
MEEKDYLLTREMLEELEDKTLAPYAMKSRLTRGRRYREKEDSFRSVYQRDRDRIIHSTAYRRLEYKTQVFVNLEGDYYRTRLTHTAEVAQIARSVARALRLNEELTESIALAHDIGHTPFGHSGETVLNRLMKDEGGFEHNMQSLRVLDELEEKYPDFPGLNLCWETREGIIKHTTDYDSPVFADYEPELSPTLESQVVNIADEIAYNSHDVDDGITSRILSLEGLKTTKIWKEIEKTADTEKFAGLPLDMQKYNLTRALISVQITNLINNSVRNLRENKIDSIEKVRNHRGLLIEFSPEMKELHRDLKSHLYNNFYKHYKVIRMEYKAEKIIQDLFDIYLKRGSTVDERGVETSILPPETKKRLKKDSLKRVICDYIASMTDRSIIEEYKKLFDPYEKV